MLCISSLRVSSRDIIPRTHHTLVEAVVLLLEPGDGQGALVSLVTLLRQRQPPLPPPADRGGGGPGGGAGECHLLPNTPHILLLRPQLDAWRISHVDLSSYSVIMIIILSSLSS